MLKSPAEFILDYIHAGCSYEGTKFTLESSMPLSKVWADLCDDNRRTFIFNDHEFKKSAKRLREGFATAQKMVNLAEPSSADPAWLIEASIALDTLAREMKTSSYELMSDVNKKCIKVGMMLMLFVLCHGIGFDDPIVEVYWKKMKLKNTVDRFMHLFIHYESLLYQGPVAFMSYLIVSQMQPGGKATRGVLWDALHSIYLFHTDIFLSADQHFKILQEEQSNALFSKIVFLPELSFYAVKTISYDNRPPLLNRIRYLLAMFPSQIRRLIQKTTIR